MTVTIFPTGTTLYDPQKCWNGYTIFQARNVGATLIDMNGNMVNQWRGLLGQPNKILPGGYVMGNTGERNPRYGFQDTLDLVQVDWEGKVVWRFNGYEFIEDPGEKPSWMARQHHDYQREGNPVGYYVPGADPQVDRGHTLILVHKNLKNPGISEKPLLDDSIIEVTWDGKIEWQWLFSDHFDQMGFSQESKNAIMRNQGANGGPVDWVHINSMSVLGPNKWYDGGDARFHPDNIIWSSRQANIIAITDKKTGRISWQLGPDYQSTEALKNLGQIIGQHHPHMIPRGLPGEGNVLVFDNGGRAGYGAPNPASSTGVDNFVRDHSRVLEFDPLSLKIIWQYSAKEAGIANPFQAYMFYSGFISSAQRLPNGNTLITEGAGGRIFEVTREHQIVWEYVTPYKAAGPNPTTIYRAYRLPYEWIPQVPRPEETVLVRLDNTLFRVPGSPESKTGKVTTIKS